MPRKAATPDKTYKAVADGQVTQKRKAKVEASPVRTPATLAAERLASIRAAVAAVRKEQGPSALMALTGGVIPGSAAQGVISTGSLSLDLAIGVGGLPRGRIVEVFGPESAGKSTLCLHIAVEAQRVGGMCIYIDVEHSMSPVYAAALGADLHEDKFLLAQPATGEEALNLAEKMATAGVALVIVDSVAGLTPKAELEGEIGDPHMGLQARMMGQAMRKLAGVASRSGTLIVFVNQIRQKIGVLYGSPETTPGGNALKYFASVRLDVRRRTQIKDGATPIGNQVDIKVIKNKCAPPFKEVTFDILWGKGINRTGDLLSAALELGVLDLSGTWYAYKDIKLGQGANNAGVYLDANPEVFAEIREKCLEAMGVKS